MHDDRLLALHLLNASGRFEPVAPELRERVVVAFSDAAALLDLGGDQVDVVVRPAPMQTIPEFGIGGVAPDSHTIFVALDPSHPRFGDVVRSELARTVAHELHHVARRRAGCRGTTLWDAVIHEGLADRFVAELYGGQPPPWSVALSTSAITSLALAVAKYGDGAFDHAAWFHGTNPAVAPRWAGYAVGWQIVGTYLRAHPDAQPSRLVGRPADSFRLSADR